MPKETDPEVIANRIIELIEQNKLYQSGELQIFAAIIKKYKFKTISNYAKETGMSYNGVKYNIQNYLLQSFTIDGETFIF